MEMNKGPGQSCKDVIGPTASRLVAIKRHPGFSLMQRVAYLSDDIEISKYETTKKASN